MNAEDTERAEQIADSIEDFKAVLAEAEEDGDKRTVRAAKAEIKSLLAEAEILKGADPETTYEAFDIKANEGIHNGPGGVYAA